MVKYTYYKKKELLDYRATNNSNVYSNCLAIGNYLYNAFGFSDSAIRCVVDEERDLDEQERTMIDTIYNV